MPFTPEDCHMLVLCARRRLDEVVKALPKAKQKDSRAYLALTMIQSVYREEKLLKDLPSGEREKRCQLSIRPLVGAYFTWVRENLPKLPQKSKTWEDFNYSHNHEKYLKVFLDDGEVTMDNNAAKQSIRGFCIGKKNWVMIDTAAGAKFSVIVYSIAETAKANNLKPYDYFEYLLTEIPSIWIVRTASFWMICSPGHRICLRTAGSPVKMI